MTDAKRKPGRPRLPDSVRKTIVLDRATIAKAMLLGGGAALNDGTGNLSLGLRRAVATAELSASSPQVDKPV